MKKLSNYHWILSMLVVTTFCLLWDPPAGWTQNQPVAEREYVDAQMAYINGLEAFENKNYDESLELLNKAYVKLPENAGINYALADVYLQINDLENAEYYSKQAQALDPNNKWYHLQLVQIYKAFGNNKAAASELKNALTYFPNDPDILFDLARTYTEINRLEEANDIYNQLLKSQGESISIRINRFKNFNRLNQKDSATVELENIRAQDPTNTSTLRLLSDYYLQLGQPNKARQTIEDGLRKKPKDPQTLLTLADIYIAQAEWDSAKITLQKVIDDSTVSVDTKVQVGESMYSTFKDDPQNPNISEMASAIFNRLLKSIPQSGRVSGIAADFFLATDQHQKALEALRQTTEQLPTNDTAWQKRLQLLLQNREIEQTIEVGEEADKHVPQDPTILYFLASAYQSNQQNSEAIKKLKEAESLPARRPLKANIFGALADTYATLGQWDLAFQYYQKAIELDTKNPIIFNNYAYYLSQQGGDLEQAEKLALQALKFSPDNSSFLDTVGWIYYKQEEYQKALDYLNKAIDTGNAGADVMEHLGHVLNKLEKPDQAKEWWQKALQEDSTRTHLKDKTIN